MVSAQFLLLSLGVNVAGTLQHTEVPEKIGGPVLGVPITGIVAIDYVGVHFSAVSTADLLNTIYLASQ